jgi:hypothetical protein
MGLGLGSSLGLDVVAKLHGLLCSCFFKTSAHVRTAPWHPGGKLVIRVQSLRSDGVHGPPSIEEATKIKSQNLFQVKNNKLSRDIKGLFFSVRFTSSQVIVMS